MIRLKDGSLVERVETMDEFLRIRALVEPVYITSRSAGRVLVPCMNTILVRRELVIENLWNPNRVSSDKMDGLRTSILDNGVCFPVPTIVDEDRGLFVILDGAHRTRMLGPEWLDCDYLPVVVLPHDMSKCLAATWQFNKTRGAHEVDLDAELIRRMAAQGMTDEQIAEKLAIEIDSVFRYRQVAGIAEVIGAGAQWSGAWEMVDEEDGEAP